jgi:Protein of unknown function (DUF2817)
MDAFSRTYAEARGKFLSASLDAGACLTSYTLAGCRGVYDEVLSVDVACVGPANAERVIVLVSGTHGSEGLCGSAIQTLWLSRQAASSAAVKSVLVHAINPWGFSHSTRANEDNVDINRNFIADGEDFPRANPTYDALVRVLHGDASEASRALALHRAYKAHFDESGWDLENDIWRGQWHRADGMMYGGNSPAWSNRIFRQILRDHAGSAGRVGFIDWHTGVGQFGEVVHLIFDDRESADYRAAVKWWGLAANADGSFKAGKVPAYRGLLCQAIRQELPFAEVAGAVIEFGTVDDFALFRADVLDRWLRHEGKNHPDAKRLREACREAMVPRDVSWRRLVEERGPRLIDQLMVGVAAW